MVQCDVTKMMRHGPKLRVIDCHRPESVIEILGVSKRVLGVRRDIGTVGELHLVRVLITGRKTG